MCWVHQLLRVLAKETKIGDRQNWNLGVYSPFVFLLSLQINHTDPYYPLVVKHMTTDPKCHLVSDDLIMDRAVLSVLMLLNTMTCVWFDIACSHGDGSAQGSGTSFTWLPMTRPAKQVIHKGTEWAVFQLEVTCDVHQHLLCRRNSENTNCHPKLKSLKPCRSTCMVLHRQNQGEEMCPACKNDVKGKSLQSIDWKDCRLFCYTVM
jgi:hypothetical protein